MLDADEVCLLVTGLLVLESTDPGGRAEVVRVKLEKLLPQSLRQRATATALATHVISPSSGLPDATLLGTIADAVAGGQQLRFTYTDQQGRVSERRVRPYRHVLRGGTWYLIAHDVQRQDWRLFRLDRIQAAVPHSVSGELDVSELPGSSIEAWLATDFGRRAPADT